MSRTIGTLYLFAAWLIMVSGVYLFTEDVWKAMGIVSAYVLYQVIGKAQTQEIQEAYYRELAKETHDEER